jgi:P27 family predicted phage terminase small subunit
MTRSPRGVGRKPKPTSLLKLRGSFNSTTHERKFEPKPIGDLDEPPPDLTDGQEDVWRYCVANMPPGVMKRIDRDMLAIWCEARDRWNTARLMQAMLDRDSKLKLLIKTPDGLAPSPYNDILDKTSKTMIRVAQELGFSPAARPRIHADAPTTIEGKAEDAHRDPWKLLEVIEGGKAR